jgi:hypothetical protein
MRLHPIPEAVRRLRHQAGSRTQKFSSEEERTARLLASGEKTFGLAGSDA